jgi:hypothetical protein
MKATDLRIGNLYEYFILDRNDERKEWWEVSVCDAQDLVYLEKNPDDKDYRPIPLTQEWLMIFEFKKEGNNFVKNNLGIGISKYSVSIVVIDIIDGSIIPIYTEIKYVHQLQNLYFALTGSELTLKQP